MDNKVRWLNYDFGIYRQDGPWKDIGGVYIFSGVNQDNIWVPVYIGQADSFKNRMPCHERWPEAIKLGATNVHAMVVKNESERAQIERALIQAYQPRLNTRFR